MEDAGRVYIDWGPGTRAWVQRAQEKPKHILEVTRIFQEEAFPGYTAFIANLSAIEAMPSNWLAALRAARVIYLLTCPRTKEQYVGYDVLPKALPVITGVRGWYCTEEEHTSELQSLMRISYAVFCLTKKNNTQQILSKQRTIP